MPSSFSPGYEETNGHNRAGGPIRSVSRRPEKMPALRRGLTNGDSHNFKNKASLNLVSDRINKDTIERADIAPRSVRPRPYDRPFSNAVNHDNTDNSATPSESSRSLLSSLSNAVSKKLTSFFWMASSPSFETEREDTTDPSPSFLRRSTIDMEEGRANVNDKAQNRLQNNSITQPHFVGETPYINRNSNNILSKKPAKKPDSPAVQPLQRANGSPSYRGMDHQNQLQIVKDNLDRNNAPGFDLSGISWQPNDPVSIVKAYREVLRRKNRRSHVRTLRNQLKDTMRQRGYSQITEDQQEHHGKHRKTPSTVSSRAISPSRASKETNLVPSERQLALAKPSSKTTARKPSARLQIMPIPDDDTSDAVLSLVKRLRQAENTEREPTKPRNTKEVSPPPHHPSETVPLGSANTSYVNSETQTDLDLRVSNGISKPSSVTSALNHNNSSLVHVPTYKPTKRKRALQLSDIPMDRAKRPGFFSVDSDDDYLEDDQSSEEAEDQSNKKRRKVSDSLSTDRRTIANKSLNARPIEEDPEVLERRKQLSTQKLSVDEALGKTKIPPSAGFNFTQAPESPTKQVQNGKTEKPKEPQTFPQQSALFGSQPASTTENTNEKPRLSFNLSGGKEETPKASSFSDLAPKEATERPAPAFQFGALNQAPQEKGSEKPISLFGSSGQEPVKPAGETTPSLSFGAPSTKRSRDSEPPASNTNLSFGKEKAVSEKPAFSFGETKNNQAPAKFATPAFSFGSSSPSKEPSETLEKEQKKPSFGFGSIASESKPGFSFGTASTEKNDEKKDKLPSFSLGTPSTKPTEVASDQIKEKPTFGFGTSASTDAKPLFSFGAAQKTEPSAPQEQAKPAFGFGDVAKTFQSSSEPKEQPKPTFGFGNAGKISQSSSESKEQPKPAFGFGNAGKISESSGEPKEQSKPAFSFGSSMGTSQQISNPTKTTESESKPAFSFGQSEPSKEENKLSPITSFQQPSSMPSFGGFNKKDKEAGSSQALSFGSADSGTSPFNFSSASSSATPKASEPSELTHKPFTSSTFGGFGKTETTNKTQKDTAALNVSDKANENGPTSTTSFGQSTTAAPFGTSSTVEPAKPGNAFSFGNVSAPSSNTGSQPQEPKPASVFGSSAPSTGGFGFDAGASTSQTPSFGFGSSSQPASNGFNFGASSAPTAQNKPDNTTSASMFSFGGNNANSGSQNTGSTFNFGSGSTSAPPSQPSFQFGDTASVSNPANIFGFQPASNSGDSNTTGSVAPPTPSPATAGSSGFTPSTPDPNNPFSAGLVGTPPPTRKFLVPKSIAGRNRRR